MGRPFHWTVLWLIAGTLQFLSSPSRANDDSDIRMNYTRFLKAAIALEPKDYLDLITPETVLEFENFRHLALHADEAHLNAPFNEIREGKMGDVCVGFWDTLVILWLRLNHTPFELQAMSSEQLFLKIMKSPPLYAMMRQLSRSESQTYRVEISNDVAHLIERDTGRRLGWYPFPMGGSERSLAFRYLKVGDEWKLDLQPILAAINFFASYGVGMGIAMTPSDRPPLTFEAFLKDDSVVDMLGSAVSPATWQPSRGSDEGKGRECLPWSHEIMRGVFLELSKKGAALSAPWVFGGK